MCFDYESNMDSDLDNMLSSYSGAKQSKCLRASQKTGQPAKVPKRTEVTPPPPAPLVLSPVATSNPQVNIPAAAAPSLPPTVQILPTIAPTPKKLALTRECLLSISTHFDEYVIDTAVGTHGATLGSNVLSRVGASAILGLLNGNSWSMLGIPTSFMTRVPSSSPR